MKCFSILTLQGREYKDYSWHCLLGLDVISVIKQWILSNYRLDFSRLTGLRMNSSSPNFLQLSKPSLAQKFSTESKATTDGIVVSKQPYEAIWCLQIDWSVNVNPLPLLLPITCCSEREAKLLRLHSYVRKAWIILLLSRPEQALPLLFVPFLLSFIWDSQIGDQRRGRQNAFMQVQNI